MELWDSTLLTNLGSKMQTKPSQIGFFINNVAAVSKPCPEKQTNLSMTNDESGIYHLWKLNLIASKQTSSDIQQIWADLNPFSSRNVAFLLAAEGEGGVMVFCSNNWVDIYNGLTLKSTQINMAAIARQSQQTQKWLFSFIDTGPQHIFHVQHIVWHLCFKSWY